MLVVGCVVVGVVDLSTKFSHFSLVWRNMDILWTLVYGFLGAGAILWVINAVTAFVRIFVLGRS